MILRQNFLSFNNNCFNIIIFELSLQRKNQIQLGKKQSVLLTRIISWNLFIKLFFNSKEFTGSWY